MGKASRTKQSVSRQERVAAQRAAAKRAEQRRNLLMAGGAVFVVLIVVAVFLVVKVTSNNNSTNNTASNGPTGTALSSLVSQVTSVPASTLEAVGAGSGVTGKPTTISGSALTANGKPEILYEGAEYCPYCAAERWAMIVALSRFGTFSGLSTIHSASKNGQGQSEVYPNTPTWTFYKSSYSSQYVTFTPVETQTNVPDSSTGGYTSLQTPTSAQNSIVTKYDGSQGSIPFIDFGNKYMISGASYSPQILAGLSWSKIAADLSDKNSTVAKAIDGTANYITAAICKLTGNQPANVCTTTITSLQSQI
jgi:Domain of unknown function (DUF929)